MILVDPTSKVEMEAEMLRGSMFEAVPLGDYVLSHENWDRREPTSGMNVCGGKTQPAQPHSGAGILYCKVL